MSKEQKSIPTARTSSLLTMAAKVALREGRNILQNSGEKRLIKMMDQADIIVRHVGQLKGAAMKAIQMMTVELHDLLPSEVLQILEKLQSQAPPLSNDLMLEHLKNQLGPQKWSQLQIVSQTPLASASIGQVYHAQYKNQDIVIKIQYPGVSESIDSDIDTLKKLVRALNFITNKQVDIDDLFAEVRRILVQETNYKNEEKLAHQYGQHFAHEKNYIIPEAFPEFTTESVIVLSKEEGLEFPKWLKTNPSQQDKEKIGQLLLDLYMKEFFNNRLVQTDPNPANFLINNNLQLVLLDFGATVAYEEDFVKSYKKLVRTVFSQSDEVILAAVLDMKFISPKESKEVKQMFVDFLRLSMNPFQPDKQPFDFSQIEYSNLVRQKALAFSKELKYSAPPKQIIFLHRKLGGIFQLLRQLQVKVDLSEFRRQILDD